MEKPQEISGKAPRTEQTVFIAGCGGIGPSGFECLPQFGYHNLYHSSEVYDWILARLNGFGAMSERSLDNLTFKREKKEVMAQKDEEVETDQVRWDRLRKKDYGGIKQNLCYTVNPAEHIRDWNCEPDCKARFHNISLKGLEGKFDMVVLDSCTDNDDLKDFASIQKVLNRAFTLLKSRGILYWCGLRITETFDGSQWLLPQGPGDLPTRDAWNQVKVQLNGTPLVYAAHLFVGEGTVKREEEDPVTHGPVILANANQRRATDYRDISGILVQKA